MKAFKFELSMLTATSLLFALESCNNSEAKQDEAAPAKPALSVRVLEVAPQPLVDAIHVSGIVKAHDDVMVSPEEGGVVKEWKVRKGQWVAKNEILVVLKDEVMKASYDAADAQYKMAELNAEKQENVYKEQGISELQYKNTLYARDAAKANADLMKARWDRTRIKSPVAGILDDYYYDAGEFAPPAVPIAHVVNINSLKILAEIPERHAGTVAVRTPAQVTFDAFPGDTLSASVNFVGSTVNASNRTLPVEIFINNPGQKLKPEMIAKVKILRSSKKNALLISANVVQLVDRGRNIVFVENGSVAHERSVVLGAHQGNLVEVVEGLKPGDRVIMTSIQSLVNGQAVSVAQE
ncbi:MAG: efflux RND transporter periplasmic adaptor subunit [Ignavibacteriales bacterium]|nr:efflux RND transporter periplasmic adaptor subunit [Ignavibacteriales bacterium]